jgi:type I restriction enzyme, S subunit
LDLNEIKTIEALPREVAELRLKPGDVVLTEGGDLDKLGRGAIWTTEIGDCIHQNHVFRVRVDPSVLHPQFFHEYLQTDVVRAYFLRCAKRTTNLASINMTQLRALPVPLPALGLQQEFAHQVAAAERLKASQRASLAKLDALFASASAPRLPRRTLTCHMDRYRRNER